MKIIIQKFKEKGIKGSIKSIGFKVYKRFLLPFYLEQRLKEIQNEFSYFDIHFLRSNTLAFIENMEIKDKPYGQYRYSHSQTKPVLYASCYAALTRHLYRDLDRLKDKQKKEWITYIQEFQSEDGLFRDSSIQNHIAENSDWWGWRHLTLHCLMALSALDAKPKKEFKIIKPFKDVDFLIKWLKNKDWTIDPAMTSNAVQNYFTLLQYARDFMGADWADKSLSVAYEWLNENQCPYTGLWGAKFNTPQELSNGVQTGYHIWLLYFYDKKNIQYHHQIIDSCLKTQNKLGGFGVPLNSSACEDIDSIDPLCRLYFISNYKKEQIKEALRKGLVWILVNMNKDGGFVFRRYEPFVYGHKLMSTSKEESAMFPTWFRTLCLAYLSKVLHDKILGKFE